MKESEEKKMEGTSIQELFANVRDPPVERTIHHQLLAFITIALCGVMCGAETWVENEEFGRSKHKWLETFLELPNGIPSHDTDAARFCAPGSRAISSSFQAVGAGSQHGSADSTDRH